MSLLWEFCFSSRCTVNSYINASISWTAYFLTIIKVQGQQVEFEIFTNSSIYIIFLYFHVGSLTFFYLLQTSMGLCMYILALHHHQFTSWVADLIFLLVCLILSQLIAIPFLVVDHELFLSHPFHKRYCCILYVALNFTMIICDIA